MIEARPRAGQRQIRPANLEAVKLYTDGLLLLKIRGGTAIPMKKRLDLSDVALCAADSANVELTKRALELSVERCAFGDAIMFSDAAVHGAFRTIKIEKIDSIADYQSVRLRILPKLIDAPFALFVEWDGYVIEPRAWTPDFRRYDYIGAKWLQFADGMTIGNSGFCLQSRKLLAALSDPRFTSAGTQNIDLLICRTYRPMLERDYGIRFAPEPVADLFSYENALPNGPTFGFHGCGNMWRHTEDSEMIRLVGLVDPYVFRTIHFVRLLASYFRQRKFVPLEAIYGKMRKHVGREDAAQLFRRLLRQPVADQLFSMCEQLLSRPASESVASPDE
jgi:hypothetical protein